MSFREWQKNRPESVLTYLWLLVLCYQVMWLLLHSQGRSKCKLPTFIAYFFPDFPFLVKNVFLAMCTG